MRDKASFFILLPPVGMTFPLMGRHIPINAGRAFAIHNLTCLRRERDWAPIGPIFISPAPNLPQRFRDWARERKIEKRQLRSLAPVGFFFFGDFVPRDSGGWDGL